METHIGLLSWIGIIVGSALALIIMVCACKCGWECYTRKRNRELLQTNIRETRVGISAWRGARIARVTGRAFSSTSTMTMPSI